MKFNFKQEPGKTLNLREYEEKDPLISVIMPFYNDKDYIVQSVNCILNQTFPLFELLIIDDGSKDEESLKLLEKVQKQDKRIKVFHKQNEGLAATRDYGVSKSSNSCKYLMILDSDDLIDKTFMEYAYWTLETNKKASWAYSDSVGFGEIEYLWNKWFNSDTLKKENFLVATALIRKTDFLEINGYELRERAVNEDWNLWLKMLAKGKFPVKMNYYGIWYRRKKQGELTKSRENKERALEIINNTAKTVNKRVKAIQYPITNKYDWTILKDEITYISTTKFKDNGKINILMIIPWMVTGGADKFNLDLISGLDKEKYDITIVTTNPSLNALRQEFEKYATVYDLTTFLDREYWLSFINNIINTRNINLIFNTNSQTGYYMLPYIKAKYPQIPIIDYVHMEEWYNRNGGYSRDSSIVASVLDKTLVCNKNTENILKEHFKRNEKEVDTVYIGVDEKEFNPELYDKEKLKTKYSIEKGKFVISFICRITEQKRPYLFLQIIKELQKQRNDFVVIVAGDGNMLQEIQKKANSLQIADKIKFLGNITKTKEVYAISDVTLNCSIKEGLALTSYESLAMGVPVISADVGGQKELINSDIGIIVPCMQDEKDIMEIDYKKEEIQNYVEAINKILNNLEQYKANCRKRILSGFTIDHMKEKMANIFENIYKNPNEDKINNGKGLANNIEITKEFLNMHFMANSLEYDWMCDEYNKNYYASMVTKWDRIRDKLWSIPAWRKFIRFLQKYGIIKKVKKVLKISE